MKTPVIGPESRRYTADPALQERHLCRMRDAITRIFVVPVRLVRGSGQLSWRRRVLRSARSGRLRTLSCPRFRIVTSGRTVVCLESVVGQVHHGHTGRPADHRAKRGWPTKRDHQNEPLRHLWGSFWWSRFVGAWPGGPRWATRQRDGARTGSVLSVLSVARRDTDTTLETRS